MKKANGPARPIKDEEMRAYLDGTLKPEQKEAFELRLEAHEMNLDALEGLMKLDSKETAKSVKKINARISATVFHKRRLHRRTQIANRPVFWQVVLAIIVMIALACLVFYFILLK